MSDLGSTFDCPDGDMHPRLPLLTTPVDKARGWLQALARRITAPQGSLWYAPNYGFGLANLMADDEEPEVAAELINQTFKQDERCASCTTTIGVNTDGTWTISSNPKTVEGVEYEFVWAVSPGKAELLSSTPGT